VGPHSAGLEPSAIHALIRSLWGPHSAGLEPSAVHALIRSLWGPHSGQRPALSARDPHGRDIERCVAEVLKRA